MRAQASSPSCYLLQAALEYGQAGLAVVPLHTAFNGRCSCRRGRSCKRAGKHPHITHWVERASTDPEQIRTWWATWPDANVGILTGTRNRIIVLDIDPRHGGDESLRRILELHGDLPLTVVGLTGGDGRHLLFRHPGRRVSSTDQALKPGIDVRGDGGLIVAPPSLHASGKEYIWHLAQALGHVDIAPMPDWLVERLADPRRLREPPTRTAGRRARFRWAEVLDGVPEGRRHSSLFLMASSLRGQGTPQGVVRELALLAAGLCRPPLPSDEAVEIVDDVFTRYPTNETRVGRLSLERVDILAALAMGVRPLKPAEVAHALGRGRDATKQLIAKMCRDGQIDRVGGTGYVISPRLATSDSELLPSRLE